MGHAPGQSAHRLHLLRLDELGLEVPTTMDELVEFAKAFVQKDAAERLRKLERTLKAIRSESSIRARVRTHLEAMFALDQAADLLEAWALNLFDRIEDVTP